MKIILVAVVLAAVGVAWLLGRPGRGRKLPRNRVRDMRMHLHLRRRPGRGHATAFELWLRWGRFAAFRKSGRSRKSLTRWQRIRHPFSHSVQIGRAQRRAALRVALEEHMLVMSPPRAGKTGWLAKLILRYPGPVVTTSTKPDVFGLTSGVRSALGPIEVFNPQRIGTVPSTISWDPIAGCRDLATAIRRADGFANAVSTTGTEDGNFWTAGASSALRAMFHAAALVGGDLRLVTHWALGSAEPAEDILVKAGAYQLAMDLSQLRGEAQKTAATIKMVIVRALSFMTDPALSLAALPDDFAFDIPSFLRDKGTLYLIAESEHDDSPVAPLFAALAGEIRYQAAQIGQASAAARLDPPLGMFLDEIKQTCPVPLNVWLADSGGKGIQIVSVVHGEAQLRTRWGRDGAQVIMDTSGVKVLLPGVTDTDTLETFSKLSGEAAYREHGQEHDSRVPVMSLAMIRELPDSFGLVIRGGMSPVLMRLGAAWTDRLYKAARRRGHAVAQLAQPVRVIAEPRIAVLASPMPDFAPGPEPELVDAAATDDPWS